MHPVGRIVCSDDEDERDDLKYSIDTVSRWKAERLAVNASKLAVEVKADDKIAGTSLDEAEAEGLFDGYDELEQTGDLDQPKIKKRKVGYQRLSPSEAQAAIKLRAIKGWLPLVLKVPQASKAGRRIAKMTESDQIEALLVYAIDKAPATTMQRLGPVALYEKWDKGEWPPTEECLIEYAKDTMVSEKVAKTRLSRFLEAVKFMTGTFQFSRSLIEVADSRYLTGMALQRVQTMPKRKSAAPISLEFVCRMEHYLGTTTVSGVFRMIVGGILILIYFRARINDADIIHEFTMYDTRFVMIVEDTKTSRCREVVTLMAPPSSLTGKPVLEDYQSWREQEGIPLGDGWPLFPAMENNVWIKRQAKTGDVNELFWAVQVRLTPLEPQRIRRCSHSCKTTMLDAAVIWGLDKPTRLGLGYHRDASSKVCDTYAPSSMIRPVAELNKMIIAYQKGTFDPDRIRAPKVKPAKCVAQQSDFQDATNSSSEASLDEKDDSDVEAGSDVQTMVQEDIAEACRNTVEPDDQLFVNLSNGKRHKGRKFDPTLTACGNPVGTNIVPLTAGGEEGPVDIEHICSNCFGRALATKRAVARRMSEPTEPLSCFLNSGPNR